MKCGTGWEGGARRDTHMGVSDAANTPSNDGDLGSTIQLIKDYARQETVGPLKGAGRWIAAGLVGAFCYGTAASFLVLGVLRLMQNEFAPTFRGRWMSVVPYIAALLVGLAVMAIAAWRISKKPLAKESR
jgi:hypothetical protein